MIAGLSIQDLPMNAVVKVIRILAASYTSYLPQCSRLPRIMRSSASKHFVAQ
jgi:hypothetical protein